MASAPKLLYSRERAPSIHWTGGTDDSVWTINSMHTNANNVTCQNGMQLFTKSHKILCSSNLTIWFTMCLNYVPITRCKVCLQKSNKSGAVEILDLTDNANKIIITVTSLILAHPPALKIKWYCCSFIYSWHICQTWRISRTVAVLFTVGTPVQDRHVANADTCCTLKYKMCQHLLSQPYNPLLPHGSILPTQKFVTIKIFWHCVAYCVVRHVSSNTWEVSTAYILRIVLYTKAGPLKHD